MAKKTKTKKVSVKRERYKKFRKDKPSTIVVSTDEAVNAEEQKQRQVDEQSMERFFKMRKPIAPRVINKRKLASKR